MQKIARQTMIDFVKQEAARGSIYVWGAQGQRGGQITEDWIRKMETSATNANRAISLWKKNKGKYDPNMIGAFDCSGLIGACLNANGNAGFDDTADGYRNRCVSIDKGALQAGDLVFEYSNGKSGHVGVYIGDGKVIEARGRDYGVVETDLNARNWKKYGRPDFMYTDGNAPAAPSKPTYTKKSFTLDHVVKKGSKEAVVGSIQNNLKAIGYDIGAAGPNGDGIDNNFGTKTDAAVRDVQKNGGVKIDGQVGKNTTPLLGGTWTEKSAPAASIPKLNRVLKYGCKGDDVRMMQERLNAHKANVGKADGEFGDKTRRGLHAFQQARINEGRDVGCGYNGNKPDDKCGELTWAMLWEPAPGE